MKIKCFNFIIPIVLLFSSCGSNETYKPITVRENILYDYYLSSKDRLEKIANREIEVNNYYVNRYYGKYHSVYVIDVDYYYPEHDFPAVIDRFYFSDDFFIDIPASSIPQVWKDHEFYLFASKKYNPEYANSTLKSAFDEGILTMDDIYSIDIFIKERKYDNPDIVYGDLDVEYNPET